MANEADMVDKPDKNEKADANEANKAEANDANKAVVANGLDNQLGGANVVELNELVETKGHDELNELVASKGLYF